MTATLYGLGVGPGDPELITVKALNILRRVPVIVYPAAIDVPSFARQIVEPYLDGKQREIVFAMPMTPSQFPANAVYDKVERQIRQTLSSGQDVAVLCEGDPFFYGSFAYLYGRMANDVRVQVVPGVSSLMTCATYAGMPLAARNDTLVILPAPLRNDVLKQGLENHDAAAIIKVGRHLGRIRSIVQDMGLVDCAFYIERASLPEQKVMPLSAYHKEQAPYFSMILTHKRGKAYVI